MKIASVQKRKRTYKRLLRLLACRDSPLRPRLAFLWRLQQRRWRARRSFWRRRLRFASVQRPKCCDRLSALKRTKITRKEL